MNRFVITEFANVFYSHDPINQLLEIKNRQYACFIIVLKGKICFTSNNTNFYADAEHPIFIPKGMHYKNHCLKAAESLVFNFCTLDNYNQMKLLSSIMHSFAIESYNVIKGLNNSFENSMKIFEQLYALANKLLAFNQNKSASEKLVNKALDYIASNYANSALTVKDISKNCFISEIYLRKLFESRLHTTPFKQLTKVRMKLAQTLILEQRPIKEVALMVGYSDIYQFSRAYKRYYGNPPTKTK